LSTTALTGYADWPDVGQVFELERARQTRAGVEIEVVYGITSLPPERADARRLLALVRGHWHIENRLHYVKDVTLGEDRCRVRTGAAPEILALLRGVAVYLREQVKAPSKAAATRRLMVHPEEALPLLLQ
jgi:hypothetical protein